MTIEDLIEALSRPEAYDEPTGPVEVCQTHLSAVFLTAEHAYKIKKPVDFGFVDYSTLERRRHFCEREVELNRRLAPDVYVGVVPVTSRDGQLSVGDASEAGGEPVEWAVKMRRLDDADTLEARLSADADGLTPAFFARLGRRIAAFHQSAARGFDIARSGSFEVVARNARDNFDQSIDQVGQTVHPDVFARARRLTEAALDAQHDRIARRATSLVPCDTHGDLRLEHVYLSDDGELRIVDCIEFNDDFRYADPVADLAFLVMDLRIRGRRELADALSAAYFEATEDAEGRELLDFYVAYRAAVRGKVHGLRATEGEVPADERERAGGESTAHWLFNLGTLAAPDDRPALVAIGGLPGTGKSTAARGLAEVSSFTVIDTDVVRKELAGLDAHASAADAPEGGIYTREWSDRTYAECRRRARDIIFAGGRALVDATFYLAERRQRFAALAAELGVPFVFIECVADRDTVRQRIGARSGDASDADWSVYEHIAERWEPADDVTAHQIRTDRVVDLAVAQALAVLAEAGLTSS